MADTKKVISQVQSVGEDAIGRIAKTDTARNAIQRATDLRDRVGKTLAGLERIETRLDAIEARLTALEEASEKTSRTTTRSAKASGEKPSEKPSEKTSEKTKASLGLVT